MIDEAPQHFFQRQDLRPSLNQREYDHAERRLHLRVLVQVVQDHLGVGITLQIENDPHPLPVRFIPDVRNIFELLFVDKVGDFFDKVCLVHLVRYFRHHNALAFPFSCFDVRLGTDDDAASARGVRAPDPFITVNDPTRREVGGLDKLHQLLIREGIFLDERDASVDDLIEVVRRDVCGHADSDAA